MTNVWIERFTGPTRDDVRRLSAFQPEPLLGLRRLHYSEAAILLDTASRALFVPTEQTVDLMFSWLAIASAHCKQTYPDARTVRASFQSGTAHFQSYLPYCLTGLAGSGKTSLFEAFERILSAKVMVNLGAGFHEYALRATVRIKIHEKLSKTAFLKGLLDSIYPGLSESAIKDLLPELLLKMHRYGVGFAISDELQHVSGSAAANTKATQLMLQQSRFCVPNVFGLNYSMCHKLLGRPQEDRDRLFSKVIILEPESIRTKDWSDTVDGYLKLIPEESAKLNLEEVANYLHPRTFGLKRELAWLLGIAFAAMHRQGDKLIGLKHIDEAYKSRSYSTPREDIDILRQQIAQGRCIKVDLWCPFQEAVKPVSAAQSSAKAALDHALVQAMIDSTINQPKKVGQCQAKPSKPVPTPRAPRPARKSNVIPIKGTLVDQFEAGMADIHDGLKPKR